MEMVSLFRDSQTPLDLRRLEGSTVGSAEQLTLISESKPDNETVEGSFPEPQSSITHSEVKQVENGAEWRKGKL